MPLFAGLEPRELEGILRIFEQVSFAAGASIVRQGQPADGAFVLERGKADVITALPGGGEAKVAELGPGSVLGEMALLEAGVRSATVIAREPVAGYYMERDAFRALLCQRNEAAFTVQSRITRTLCQRLRELNARILDRDAPGAPAPEARQEPRSPVSFDFRAFLPALPFFRQFTPADVEALAAMGEPCELPRGALVFAQGAPSKACGLVVRGAVEVSVMHGSRSHRLGILGPGRMFGHMAVIEALPVHTNTATARERTALLELGRAVVERLLGGGDRLANRFQDAVNRNLLEALVRTNNHLTRLISQACIRERSGRDSGEVRELQRVLSTQDCRAA